MNNQKYGVTLDGRHLMIIYARTNQKQVLIMEKGKERRFDQAGHVGGAQFHPFWGESSWGVAKNLKYN